MRQVFPNPVDNIDVATCYAGDHRPKPAGRPWVLANMIQSLDGSVAIDGVSGGLGGPGDKAVFRAIRAVADVIVVASGTVLAENYRPPLGSDEIREQRQRRGQAPTPRLAIVSGRLGLPNDHRVFSPEARPLIITTSAAPQAAKDRLAEVADVVEAGSTTVDPGVALSRIDELGAKIVLLEGGPTLNGAFVTADLVDEWCLSSSPNIVGGGSPRIVHGAAAVEPRAMRLDRLVIDDSFCFFRWVRDRG